MNSFTGILTCTTAVLLLLGAVYEGFELSSAIQMNQLIEQPDLLSDKEEKPELIFARANFLAAKGEKGEAMRLYGTILHMGEPEFLAKVRYNLGTLYLQDAASLWNAKGVLEYVRVNTLVAMAKEHLREAVRLQPDLDNASYNLEYAYRITPPPKERPKENFQGSKGSVFATMPSIPGGGP